MTLSIEMRRDARPVTTLGSHVPDPEWSYTDPAGHEHRFAGGELPTLEWVVTDTEWCEMCRDEHEEGEYRCRECGAVVAPGYNWTGPQTHLVPGLTEYVLTLDGESCSITEDEAKALMGLAGDEQKVARARLLLQPEIW